MAAQNSTAPRTMYTVGHSTRTGEEFLELLEAHGIRQLVDVRTIPTSARQPQFNATNLIFDLQRIGCRYIAMPMLGGFRRPQPHSHNLGWRSPSFRGYADYMQTDEFSATVEKLIILGMDQKTAIMCAESVPWRCHRSLIADALVVRGVPVEDLLTKTRTQPHRLTPWARVHGKEITYPATRQTQSETITR